MAIGPDGKVTTTGLMNSPAKTAEAPDMSNLKPPAQPQEQKAPPAAMAQRPEPKDPAVVEKLNALSEEEKIQLDMVLSPSLSNILKKISPDASSVIDQFTSQEENVILVCMHGRAMRILLCYLLDLPLSQMDTFEHTRMACLETND